MSIKNAAVSSVLALMFLSLLVIYMISLPSPLITFLSVLIMLVGLIMAQSNSWRDIGILAAVSVVVSMVAIALVASARLGLVGTLIALLLWGLLLFALFSSARRSMVVLPKDRAIVVLNSSNGQYEVIEGPLATPPLPFVERHIATVPLYDLYEEVSVKDINTKATHNIDEIRTNIRYYVSDPRLAVTGIPDRAQAEEEIAKDLKQEVREARLAPVFWEKLLGSQLSRDAAEIIRTVVFSGQYTAPQAYDRREEVQQDIFERLQSRVEAWGILIRRVDLEYVKVDGERFKALNWERMLERESYVKQIESERDALRIRNVLSAEVDAESRRVTEIIKALRDSGVDITPDLIVRAITATSDWQVEGDFSLLTQQAPPPPVVPAPPKPPEKPAEKK